MPSNASQTGSTWGTPTVVHFTAVLLLAGAGAAPWQSATSLDIVWGIGGAVGLVYQIDVIRRLRRQTAYKPEAEDWLFHAVLPLVAYGLVATAAACEPYDLHRALFVVAGAVLLLLVIGIHNAWDAASYHVFTARAKKAAEKSAE
jgi:hypothetical protein